MAAIRHIPEDFNKENYVVWVDKKGIGFSENKTWGQKLANWLGKYVCNFSALTGCSYRTSKIWSAFETHNTHLSNYSQRKLFPILEEITKEEQSNWKQLFDRDVKKIDLNTARMVMGDLLSKAYQPVINDDLLENYFNSLGFRGDISSYGSGSREVEDDVYKSRAVISWSLSEKDKAERVFKDLQERKIPGVTMSETSGKVNINIDVTGHDLLLDCLNLIRTPDLIMPPPPPNKPLVEAYLASVLNIHNAHVVLTPHSIRIAFDLPNYVKEGQFHKFESAEVNAIREHLQEKEIESEINIGKKGWGAPLRLVVTMGYLEEIYKFSRILHEWNKKQENPIQDVPQRVSLLSEMMFPNSSKKDE